VTTGLLDLPAPLYTALDRALAGALPPLGRLAAWAALGAVVSVLLYRALSPQRRIAQAKARAQALRAQLDTYEGEFAQALPLLRAQFGASLRHVGLVLPGTLLASLPVLTLLVWLDSAYAYRLPGVGEPAPVLSVSPPHLAARWQAEPPGVTVVDGARTIAQLALTVPVTRVEQRAWWNALIANPVGYLPAGGVARRLEIGLPAQRYLDFGPPWLGSWLTVFLTVLAAVSLAVHRLARVE
jgi:hypothetical protein